MAEMGRRRARAAAWGGYRGGRAPVVEDVGQRLGKPRGTGVVLSPRGIALGPTEVEAAVGMASAGASSGGEKEEEWEGELGSL